MTQIGQHIFYRAPGGLTAPGYLPAVLTMPQTGSHAVSPGTGDASRSAVVQSGPWGVMITTGGR